MSKEAMKLALEALEGLEALLLSMGLTHLIVYGDAEKAITNLQKALANEALDKMAENARELGLDYEPLTGTQISKVWLDGEKLMAEPIDPATMYKDNEVAQPDSTCNKTLRAEGKGYPRTCRKCGKGPCIADRVRPEQEQWDAIPDAFNEWWNADYDDTGNPYRKDSPAYWAWSGWKAASKQPAQRTWVGLTDDEIERGCKESWVTEQAWQSAVWWAEAKLKEKNNG